MEQLIQKRRHDHYLQGKEVSQFSIIYNITKRPRMGVPVKGGSCA